MMEVKTAAAFLQSIVAQEETRITTTEIYLHVAVGENGLGVQDAGFRMQDARFRERGVGSGEMMLRIGGLGNVGGSLSSAAQTKVQAP